MKITSLRWKTVNILFALVALAFAIGLVLCAAINRLLVGKNLKKLLRGSIHVSKKEDEEDSYPYVDVVMPDGSVKRAISVLGRLSLRDVDWEIMSPEQKTATLLRVFVMILSLAGVVILLFKSSILSNAAGIFIFHNHPSGNLKPSKDDYDITKRLVSCGKLLDIQVVDHIIVSSGSNKGYYSFKEHGEIDALSRNAFER